MNFVAFYDALRFTNGLANGQGTSDTETGAYTLLGGTETPSNGTWVTRNAAATIFLTSEDHWHKAAYYDAASTSFNPYPFADGFNGALCESPASTTSHSANCNSAVGNTTAVGAYTNSPSAYGTFDQGGNVFESNEAMVPNGRGLRGGNWFNNSGVLAATTGGGWDATTEQRDLGFRIASLPVPEPATDRLLAAGLAALAWRARRELSA